MELDMMGIGERIKTRRKELKLSQTDIYERCDITSGALSKIENGKTTPSVIAFYKLSQVLECDMNWLATGISSNMQKSNICKLEEELLNGFRELPEDDKEELMGFLCSWKHVMEDCHTKALIQFSNFIFAGCVPDRWMPHVDFFNHFVLLIRDSSFNSFLKFLLLHPAPPSFLHSSIF